jgi:hypothetical protein
VLCVQWAVLAALILVRLIFGPPLPDSQRATLFLLISTAALATAAIIFQDAQGVTKFVGPYSSLGEFFHWMSTFLAILCYFLLLNGYFCRSPFNVSYWAISFPSAALGLVWLFYWHIGNCGLSLPSSQYSSEERCINNQDSDTIRGIVILTIVNASVSNSVLAVNTILALLQKRLFLPMPQWSPAMFLQLHHFAFRTAVFKAGDIISKLQSRYALDEAVACPMLPPASNRFHHSLEQTPLVGMDAACPCSACLAQSQPTPKQLLQDCLEMLVMLNLSLNNYIHLKRDILWPELHIWMPLVEFPHLTENDAVHNIQCELHAAISAASTLDPSLVTCAEVKAALDFCQARLTTLAGRLHVHLDREETILTPLVHHFTDLPLANRLMRKMWKSMEADLKRVVIPWIINVLPDHGQRMAFIDCLGWSTEDMASVLGQWLDGSIDPFLYQQLCVDFPLLKNREASQYAKFW